MLINTRKKDLKKLPSGEIPLRCCGCSQLKIKDWVSNNKIKYLSLWTFIHRIEYQNIKLT